MHKIVIKIFSFLFTLMTLISLKLGITVYPNPFKKIEMSKFVQTFGDEFEGELDRTVWDGPFGYGSESFIRRGSYWNANLAYTKDGNLVIPLKYLDDGMGNTGPGWYTACLETAGKSENASTFSQKYGYFEVRCILPKGSDIWSAFWLMNEGVYNVDGSGKDGTEIDIFESDWYGKKPRDNRVSANLHWDGYADGHKVSHVGTVLVKGNPYEEFNTYGFEWNERGYIFYINGKEYARSNAGGVCENPLYLILSVEVEGKDAIPSKRDKDANETEFIIDYVRVYQYKDKI